MRALYVTGRTVRAIVAIGAIAALAILFVAQRGEMVRAKERALHTVSSTSWMVSELVFETLRFAMALRLHATGEVTRSDVQLRFELLWSRIAVLENTAVSETEAMISLLTRLDDTLTGQEALIFDRPLIQPRLAISLAAQMSDTARELRVAWLDTFRRGSFTEQTVRDSTDPAVEVQQKLIVGLIGLLVLYLVVEIVYAGIAQKREMRLRRKAAQASEAKTRFLANVSHEIRTPLNGILGMASELGESRLDGDQKACVRVIRQSGEVLLNTLNDILDLSKVEAGEMVMERQSFDPGAVLEGAQELFRATARDKGLRLVVTLAPDLPARVLGDDTRLRQVLHNLVSNALKFTAEGGVTVAAEPAPASGCIRISVTDTGPGIAPHAQKRIFRPFTQADASITRKHGGTGLGLSISHQLVRAMGGTLRLESVPGQGACFWFDLPLPDATDAVPLVPVERAPAPPQSGLRVLVVDDNATNRLILRRYLKDTAEVITEAETGLGAVKAATEETFDVVLMDIQMPQMDGIEATRRIRRFETVQGRPAVHIIAVTANVMQHQREGYLDEGMDDVLGKPVAKQQLLARLAARNAGPDEDLAGIA